MANPQSAIRLFLSLSLIALGAAMLPAPRAAAGVGIGTQIDNGLKDFDKKRATFRALLLGDQKASPEEMKDVASAAARWYVYRVTWDTYRIDPKKMQAIHADFKNEATKLATDSLTKNQAFLAIYSKKLIECLAKVLALDMENAADRQAVVNAALMLPQVAKFKQEEFGDFLAGLLKDPKTPDVVKFWAVRGLGEFLPARAFSDAAGDLAKLPKVLKDRMDRDLERVGLLVEMVERQLVPELNDEGKPTGRLVVKGGSVWTPEPFRYVRREAVRVLAKAGVPAVVTYKSGKVEAPVARALLHVLAKPARPGFNDEIRFVGFPGKSSFNPPPTLAERVEAALGVCQLKFDNPADPLELYNPEIGMYLVGHLLADFVDAYRADYGNKIGQKNVWMEPPALPWKTNAQQLDLALNKLDAMTRKLGSLPLKDKMKALITTARPSLKEMAAGRQVTDAVDRAALEKLRPTDSAIFRTPKGMPVIEGPNFID